MSKRSANSASTGQSRRDKATQTTFNRLTSKLTFLESNPHARQQLTQIVFGSLTEIRRTEDRSVELCSNSVDSSCSYCNWAPKSFCEVCGTDFTRVRQALPMFIPLLANSLLHIDVCMLCSEKCVDKLVAQREALEAEKMKNSQAKSSPAAAVNSHSETSSIRRTRSVKDPQLTPLSAFFHAGAYALILYTLFLANYKLHTIGYYLTGWTLLGQLAFFGVWILNILFSWSSGGGISNVYRLRQVLSYMFSINFVLCTGTTILFWTMATLQPSSIKPVNEPPIPMLEEHMKHTLPMVLMAIEMYAFPHIKIVSIQTRQLKNTWH